MKLQAMCIVCHKNFALVSFVIGKTDQRLVQYLIMSNITDNIFIFNIQCESYGSFIIT